MTPENTNPAVEPVLEMEPTLTLDPFETAAAQPAALQVFRRIWLSSFRLQS